MTGAAGAAGAAGAFDDDVVPPDFAARAAELYAHPLDQFVSARNSTAAEARKSGDKDLAAGLRALPKPSSAAWLVNVLVQRRRAEVEQVIELGASLKEAQSGMDRAQLQALGQQRQRLLAAVARESLAAASEAGHGVGEAALPGVEQTLRAALADPAAAAAVLTGRLIRTLEASGWDAVDLTDAVAGPFDPPGTAQVPEPSEGDGAVQTSSADGGRTDARSAARAARRRKQAEAALSAARASREAAEIAATEAHREVERTRERHVEMTSSVEELEQRLGTLRGELTDLATTLAALTEEAAEAADELAEAREDEEAALADLEESGS